MSNDLFKYRFDAQFERQLLRSLLLPAGDSLLPYLVSESFVSPEAVYFVNACKEIAKKTGRSPRDIVVVLQYLTSELWDRRVLTKQMFECLQDYCIEVSQTEVSDPEQIITSASETVRGVELYRAVEALNAAYGDGKPLESNIYAIQRTDNIGKVSVGRSFSSVDPDDRTALASAFIGEEDDKDHILPCGIRELDKALGGGYRRAEFFMLLGGTGDGKSRALNGLENVALGRGINVYHASNEMYEGEQYGIFLAGCLKVDSRQFKASRTFRAECVRDYERRLESQNKSSGQRRGTWVYEHFTARERSALDVIDGFKRARDRLKIDFGMLGVDYLLKLLHNIPSKESFGKKHTEIARSAEVFQEFASNENLFLVGCHQGVRRKDKNGVLTKDDGAESQDLARTVQIITTLNPVDSGVRGVAINPDKLRDAPPVEIFTIEHCWKFGVLTQEQAGWIPLAATEAYQEELQIEIANAF